LKKEGMLSAIYQNKLSYGSIMIPGLNENLLGFQADLNGYISI
jgi:hypothetical protein